MIKLPDSKALNTLSQGKKKPERRQQHIDQIGKQLSENKNSIQTTIFSYYDYCVPKIDVIDVIEIPFVRVDNTNRFNNLIII